MTDLAQAFAELARSTAEFHERFDTTTDIWVARDVFLEEVMELRFELPLGGQRPLNPVTFAEEWADVLTTMFGLARAAGVSHEQLAEAVLQVAAKNDAKTHETHVKHPVTGKVTSRAKLEGGV